MTHGARWVAGGDGSVLKSSSKGAVNDDVEHPGCAGVDDLRLGLGVSQIFHSEPRKVSASGWVSKSRSIVTRFGSATSLLSR